MKKSICSIPKCSRDVFIKKHQLCLAHIKRLYKHGFVEPTPIAKRRKHAPYKLNQETDVGK